MKVLRFLACVVLALSPLLLVSQQPDLIHQLRFRQIGPFRGGRVVAVAGIPSQPGTYYFGGVGGGIFKTTDSGLSWAPVSDGQLKTGSVGAIAVADSDPNTVYVAALGHLWGPNQMRGVYRTTDGGATWKQVLKRNSNTGAVDLAMDPSNPRVIYASFWEISRKPWRMDSGGPGSGLFKTTDGGDTWNEISRAPGLPRGVLGRIGVTVSPANPERVWALVEASDGGLFRSDNA